MQNTEELETRDSRPNLEKEEVPLTPQQIFNKSGRGTRILEQVIASLREGNREDEEMRKEYGLE